MIQLRELMRCSATVYRRIPLRLVRTIDDDGDDDDDDDENDRGINGLQRVLGVVLEWIQLRP